MTEIIHFLAGKPVGKRPLGISRRRWEKNMKIYPNEIGCGLDSSGSGWKSYEHCDKTSGSIKDGELLHQLSDHHGLKTNSVPWSSFTDKTRRFLLQHFRFQRNAIFSSKISAGTVYKMVCKFLRDPVTLRHKSSLLLSHMTESLLHQRSIPLTFQQSKWYDLSILLHNKYRQNYTKPENSASVSKILLNLHSGVLVMGATLTYHWTAAAFTFCPSPYENE
jgi:hypothetical protein